MELAIERPELRLQPGEVLTLDDAEGTRIDARSGTVWVTEEDSPEDHILAKGEGRVVQRGGRTLVQALETAWVVLRKAA